MTSVGCSKVKKAGRKDQRGGEWSGVSEVRYARSNDAGEVSNNDLARVRVRVGERMGGSLGENERVREWV